MKQLFGNLWAAFLAAGAPARWAVGAIVLVAAAVAGVVFYQANNPHFGVLVADLDDAGFNRAVSALANANIRFETTQPPGPYTIMVPDKLRSEALNAVYLDGGLGSDARGIDANLSGASAAFLGAIERDQRSAKRDWQETELQLEALQWVKRASVKVSGAIGSTVAARRDDRRASAIVLLQGGVVPDSMQRRTLAKIVSMSTGVAMTSVQVSDQLGNMLFDGGAEEDGETLMSIERSWQNELERRLQAKLDLMFGAGLSMVGVNGVWSHVRQESVEETLDPAKKPSSERTFKVEGSSAATTIGGPAGVYSNTADNSSAAGAARGTNGSNSTNESEKKYVFGSKTTHSVAQPHVLERMTLSLVLDSSLADQLEAAEKIVKAAAGFDLGRGDVFEGEALALHGLTRSEDGKPILPEPEPAPQAPNPLIRQLVEHGIEILAAVAFLLVLMKSLKGARQAASGTRVTAGGAMIDIANGTATIKLGADGKPMLSDLLGDEEVDLDLLARKHVEELLESEPEKVSALLSRWALGEQFYAGTEAR